MVGISGSGKTTLAKAVESQLLNDYPDIKLQVIDGDVIREQFGIFGFTKEERFKCNQAVRVVVSYLLKNGISVILTQVAAYEEMRQNMRKQFEDYYIEAYIKCSIEECAKRDVKGYYAKANKGNMKNLNGANDVYEIPTQNEIEIDTERCSIEEGKKKILHYLETHEYV